MLKCSLEHFLLIVNPGRTNGNKLLLENSDITPASYHHGGGSRFDEHVSRPCPARGFHLQATPTKHLKGCCLCKSGLDKSQLDSIFGPTPSSCPATSSVTSLLHIGSILACCTFPCTPRSPGPSTVHSSSGSPEQESPASRPSSVHADLRETSATNCAVSGSTSGQRPVLPRQQPKCR